MTYWNIEKPKTRKVIAHTLRDWRKMRDTCKADAKFIPADDWQHKWKLDAALMYTQWIYGYRRAMKDMNDD